MVRDGIGYVSVSGMYHRIWKLTDSWIDKEDEHYKLYFSDVTSESDWHEKAGDIYRECVRELLQSMDELLDAEGLGVE